MGNFLLVGFGLDNIYRKQDWTVASQTNGSNVGNILEFKEE